MHEMPEHFPIDVDKDGNGPAFGEDVARTVCWCGTDECQAYASPTALRRQADQIESASYTGIAAQWCPVHGTCGCPRNDDDLPQLDDPRCPLHGMTGSHAEAYRAVESTGT